MIKNKGKKVTYDWLLAWFWPTIEQLFINYLSIIAAFVVLLLLGDKVEDIVGRVDILASIIITSVCIAWQSFNDKKHIILRDIGLAYGVIGIIIYVVLTLSDRINENFSINFEWTRIIGIIGIIMSIIILGMMNYDSARNNIQKEASESRNTKQDTIDNKKIDI